jgi:hypothetical protein
MMIFQAGVADGDQRFEEFGVFGGNGELRRRYICLNVAGDNHHNIRGRWMQFRITLTRSFHIALLYMRSAVVSQNQTTNSVSF